MENLLLKPWLTAQQGDHIQGVENSAAAENVSGTFFTLTSDDEHIKDQKASNL